MDDIKIKINDKRYILTWWNKRGRAECNAFTIKLIDNKGNESDKEYYYLRFKYNILGYYWYVI